MELLFASNNSHKVTEINNILGNSFVLKGLKDADITEDIPETAPTLEGNALQKARYVHEKTGRDVFADDTGLEVESLNGMPGVNSARFAGENKDSDANIDKLLLMLKGKENRKARFRTVIALIIGGEEHLFEGIVEGTIISDRRGREGFGYDPIFVPEGRDITFAEMPLTEKNKISHRARAFEKLRAFLMSRNISSLCPEY
ncbi:MAG TPA: non-canonical purine NTP diphosphatase [Bacteroidetes bacterium]|nr:non-canonical purine NTP diphosphatase [Bacteroidota bacterium]